MIMAFFRLLYNIIFLVIALAIIVGLMIGYKWGKSSMEDIAISKGYAGYERTVTKSLDGSTEVNYEFKWKDDYSPGAEIRQKKTPLWIKYGSKIVAWGNRHGLGCSLVSDGKVVQPGDYD